MASAQDPPITRPSTKVDKTWYEWLGVTTTATDEEITAAVERLSRQASSIANTAPDRSQSLRETVRSIRRDLLSGPEARARYDAQIAAAPPTWGFATSAVPTPPPFPPGAVLTPAPQQAPPVRRLLKFLQTGWTCPACGFEGTPSDKFCQSCGTAMSKSPPPPAVPSPVLLCRSCAATLQPGDSFCQQCGVRV